MTFELAELFLQAQLLYAAKDAVAVLEILKTLSGLYGYADDELLFASFFVDSYEVRFPLFEFSYTLKWVLVWTTKTSSGSLKQLAAA